MQGSIRFIVGLVLVMGGVGGMEQSMEAFPIYPMLISIAGLLSMYWATKAMKE